MAAPLFVLYSVRELLPLDYTVLQLGSWVRVPLWALVTAQGLGLSAALYRSVDAAGPPPVWRAPSSLPAGRHLLRTPCRLRSASVVSAAATRYAGG